MVRLSPGRWINSQLQLLSWLGEDLHGDSFLAEQRPQGKNLLVKVLNSDACRSPFYQERFLRCAERAMAITHRHMPAVHAFGFLSAAPFSELPPYESARTPPPVRRTPTAGSAVPGIPWLATDPVDGPDLRTLLIEGVSPATLGNLLLPIAELLDHAAAVGLEHGELSPADLIVHSERVLGRSEQRLMLLDLGLAKVLAEDPLDIPMTPGLLHYRSPEQCVSSRQIDAASDRYALATILYECVAGRPPFVGPAATDLILAHCTAPVPPLRTLVKNLDRAQALDAFFVRALAKQPEARYPSATAMLEEFLIALGEPLSPGPVGQKPIRRRSPRWYRLTRQGERPGEPAAAPVSLDIIVGPRAVLGKQPECDVICQGLPSPTHDEITRRVSREHAVLIWLDERLNVLDQSKSGTYANGRRIGTRLTPLADGTLLRIGEKLTLSLKLVESRVGQSPAEVVGVLLERRDDYAAGVPATLVLWQRLALASAPAGSPLTALGGAFTSGDLWVSQRELWWSGHPAISWRRHDGTAIVGAAPLREGDVLIDSQGQILVEH